MPVHRHMHADAGTVFAFADELDSWIANRTAAPTSESDQRLHRVAVLPFQMRGRVSDQAIGDGLVDQLISQLSAVQSIRVLSQASTVRFRGTRQPVHRIAGQLKVDSLIEGSVVRVGPSTVVTARVIQAASGSIACSVTSEAGDLSQVVTQTGDALVRHFGGRGRPASDASMPSAAFEHFLRARVLLDADSLSSVLASRAHIQRALEAAPGSAVLYGTLATCQLAAGRRRPGTFQRAVANAERAAARAIAIDGRNAEALVAMAEVRSWTHEFADADAYFKAGLAAAPSYAVGHAKYALWLSCRLRHAQALHHARNAYELDPLSYRSRRALAVVLYASRDYSTALKYCRQALDLNSHSVSAWGLKARLEAALGDLRAAKRSARKTLQFTDRQLPPTAMLVYICLKRGEHDEAQRLDRRLRSATRTKRALALNGISVACAACAFGDHERALTALEAAVAARHPDASGLGVDPLFDDLRKTTRFNALLRRLALPDV